MSNLKNEMLRIKVKGYFDSGDLKADSTISLDMNKRFIYTLPYSKEKEAF